MDGDIKNICFFLSNATPNRNPYFRLMQSDILESVQENYVHSYGHVCGKILQGWLVAFKG